MLAPHEVLGVPEAASPSELRAAFKRRALESHPDKGGSSAAFQQVLAAYELLVAGAEVAGRRARASDRQEKALGTAGGGGVSPRKFKRKSIEGAAPGSGLQSVAKVCRNIVRFLYFQW